MIFNQVRGFWAWLQKRCCCSEGRWGVGGAREAWKFQVETDFCFQFSIFFFNFHFISIFDFAWTFQVETDFCFQFSIFDSQCQIFQGVGTEHSNTKGPLGRVLDVYQFAIFSRKYMMENLVKRVVRTYPMVFISLQKSS